MLITNGRLNIFAHRSCPVSRTRTLTGALIVAFCTLSGQANGATTIDHPFLGVTHITRTETSPRPVTMHIVQIDLSIPGIRFRLTPPGGTRETIRQTTLAYLSAQQAQVAINGHFFSRSLRPT